MEESVAVANAGELFKLIFLSKSTSPEAPTLLAKTLRRYSEHDLFAAFNYLREKKIMVSRFHALPMFVAHHQSRVLQFRLLCLCCQYGKNDLIDYNSLQRGRVSDI